MTRTRILVATDFSACAHAAARAAARLARRTAASVDVVTVVDSSGWTERIADPVAARRRAAAVREEAERHADTFRRRHFARLPAVAVHVRDGADPVVEILATARRLKSDLIVLGTHGKTGLRRLILGSVAETVVRTSPVPVLTVRAAVPAVRN